MNIDYNRMSGGETEINLLTIRNVSRNDAGNYRCELENEYGVGISDDGIEVEVYCKYF